MVRATAQYINRERGQQRTFALWKNTVMYQK